MKKINDPTAPALDLTAPSANDSRALVTQSPAMSLVGVDINALLTKAIDSKSAVEIIKELRTMALEDQQRAAKREFDLALAAFQSECPVIKKGKFGAKQAYRYCPLDEMIPQVQPLLDKHHFSFTLSSDVSDGFVKAILELKHFAGHSEKSEFKVPVDSRNPMMNEQQRYGGAMTFAKRYAFCNALGIMTGDEDRDGATGKDRPLGPSSTKQPEAEQQNADQLTSPIKDLERRLWNLLKPIVGQNEGWDKKTWDGHAAWLRGAKLLAENEQVKNLSVNRLQEIIEKAEIVISEM